MIQGLSEFEAYRVIRPVIGGCELGYNDIPIIRKTPLEMIDWENIFLMSFRNLSKKQNNRNTLAHMFRYDKELFTLWNNPLKWVPLFQTCAAVSTPDFSAYPSMNINEIQHNVYMAHFLGCTWQNYGCTVLPTVGWADERTYDICFAGFEVGTPVIISTLGCQDKAEPFLNGFNEMKRRIQPPLIIVYGDMIPGMTGTFIQFKYKDAFASDCVQLRIESVSNIFTIQGGDQHGISRGIC